MTRQKKIEKWKQVKELLIIFIEAQGAFDWWLDGNYLFPMVAQTAGCSVKFVKRVFFKDLYYNNRSFINDFQY